MSPAIKMIKTYRFLFFILYVWLILVSFQVPFNFFISLK